MKPHFLSIELEGEEFYLLPHKALYRPAKQQLILSDLHLGKTSHFRKAGIPIPQQSQLKDIDLLRYLISQLKPQSVIFLGDLFHSHYNREWFHFTSLLREYEHVQFILVEGNHDILHDKHYQLANLQTIDLIEEDGFIFTHHPLEDPRNLNICGHLHPGIVINGKAKQYIKLPCFYHSQSHFILPAFGSLTGLYLLDQEPGNTYYIIYDSLVRRI